MKMIDRAKTFNHKHQIFIRDLFNLPYICLRNKYWTLIHLQTFIKLTKVRSRVGRKAKLNYNWSLMTLAIGLDLRSRKWNRRSRVPDKKPLPLIYFSLAFIPRRLLSRSSTAAENYSVTSLRHLDDAILTTETCTRSTSTQHSRTTLFPVFRMSVQN